MHPDIDKALRGSAAARRTILDAGVGRGVLDHELRSGRLIRPFPRGYLRPWDADQVDALEQAAYLGVGLPVAFSHLTALRRWELNDAPSDIHLLVPYRRRARPRPGLIVHRTRVLPPLVERQGFAIVTVDEAIVTSWSLLPARDRRAPAIAAVRRRLVLPSELHAALARHPRLADRHELGELIGLLEAGCESALEIWGLRRVFDVPGLRHGVRQRRLDVRGRTYRLDLAYDAERVAVEMDGDRWHSSKEQRERDRRRDAALASIGWLTLRFSYGRLHDDVAGCRQETLDTLGARRHL